MAKEFFDKDFKLGILGGGQLGRMFIQEAINYCEKTWPEEYSGGVADLHVAWVEEGRRFIVEEYDGAESLLFEDKIDWIIA